mmetsp:Transcript_37458/g.83359  ORF Transcript_37458/g.83359 Transcript_37458/m.83359 type:complete len:329 (-) Transcript_37458:882-1868(-)
MAQELLDHLRRALEQHPGGGRPRVLPVLHAHHHRHALEVRGEVVAVQQRHAHSLVGAGGHVRGVVPLTGLQRRLLQGVSDQLPPLHDDQGVAGRHDLLGGRPLAAAHHVLQQQVVTGQRAGLVKAAHLNLAGIRDPERLCAEDPLPRQSHQRGVDRHGQLHGQLGGDDAGDDHDAVEHKLEPVPVGVRQAVTHHVPGGRHREDHEEEDEDARLQAVGRHALAAEHDGAHEPALSGLEAGAEHNRQATAVVRPDARRLVPCVLQDLGPPEQHVVLVLLGVQLGLGVQVRDGDLPLGSGLSGQHRLLHDAAAGQQQAVGRHHLLIGSGAA